MNYLVVDNYLLLNACEYGWNWLVLYNSVVPRLSFLLIILIPTILSLVLSFLNKLKMSSTKVFYTNNYSNEHMLTHKAIIELTPIAQVEEACKADLLVTVIDVEQAKDDYGQLTTFFSDARKMAISYGMQAEINLRGDSLLVKFTRPEGINDKFAVHLLGEVSIGGKKPNW